MVVHARPHGVRVDRLRGCATASAVGRLRRPARGGARRLARRTGTSPRRAVLDRIRRPSGAMVERVRLDRATSPSPAGSDACWCDPRRRRVASSRPCSLASRRRHGGAQAGRPPRSHARRDRQRVRRGGRVHRPAVLAAREVVAAAITPVIVTLVSESAQAPVTKVQEAGSGAARPRAPRCASRAGRDFGPSDPEEERIEVDPRTRTIRSASTSPARGSGSHAPQGDDRARDRRDRVRRRRESWPRAS